MIKTWFSTFFIFSKIALFAFGGGYAMLPILQGELVDRRGWLTESELADYYAMAQCQPGPLAVNCSVLIGTSRFGTIAGIFAALGIAFPSLVIILTIALLLENYIHIPQVAQALAGIKVAVAALVINAAWRLFKNGVKGFIALIFFIASLALLLTNILNPILIILISAAFGIFVGLIKSKREDKA